MDLDSPLTKSIKALQALQTEFELSLEDVDTIDYMIYLLNSRELYATKIQDAGGDGQVTQWLNNMVNHGKMESKKEDNPEVRKIDIKGVQDLVL